MGWFDNVLGGIVSGALGIFGANANRDWQERMANTAHQREVDDLKKAGLNPMLSVMGGSGAAVPQGGFVVPENPFKTASADQVAAKRLVDIEKEQLELQKQSTQADIAQKATQSALNKSNEEMNTYHKQKILADMAYVNQLALTEDSKRQVNSAVAARELAAAVAQEKLGNYYDAHIILSGITGSKEQQMIQTLMEQQRLHKSSGLHLDALRKSEELRQFKLANEAQAETGFGGKIVPWINKWTEPVRKFMPFVNHN